MIPGAVTIGNRKKKAAAARRWHVHRARGLILAARRVPSSQPDARPAGAYTDARCRVLARTVRALLAACPTLSAERIAGHSDIAPGRKTEPGPAFDWARLRATLSAAQRGAPQ